MASCLGVARFAYTPLLPAMANDFAWSFAQAGDVASANFVGYMVGAMLAAKVANGAQLRMWLALSLMASAATTFMGSSAESYVAWLLVRFASGITSAFCLVLITTQLIWVLSEYKADRYGNVHFAGVGIGILLCMAFVQQINPIHQHWANLGGLAAALMAFAWILISSGPWKRPAPQAEPVELNAPGSSASVDPSTAPLWRIITGYGLFGYGYVVAATFVVAMAAQLLDAEGLSGTGVNSPLFVWWVVGAALVPSVYLWQWLANKFGNLLTLKIAYLVECLGMVAAALSESMASLIFACVLLGGTFGAITALGISAARNAAPHKIAQAVSGMTTAFALGQLLGPAVSGRMADYFGGFFWPSMLAALVLFIAAFLIPRKYS